MNKSYFLACVLPSLRLIFPELFSLQKFYQESVHSVDKYEQTTKLRKL